MNKYLEEIKELIKNNDIDFAVERTLNITKALNVEMYNETILLSSRLKNLIRTERKGTITRDESNVRRNIITESLIELIDDIDKKAIEKDMPFTTTDVTFLPPKEATLEKIFGVNHLKSIAWLETGIEKAKSICRVITNKGVGSGFLFNERTIMTNNHVIPNESVAEKTIIEFNYQESINGEILPVVRYRLKKNTVMTNVLLDYTTVEVEAPYDNVPLKTWGYLEIEKDDEPLVGDHVTIIQHPDGGPKQIALTANQVVNIYDHRIQYSTDTLPGSSGAPVVDDNWNVIAVHNKGGNIIVNEKGDRMFANEGTLISYIMSDLKNKKEKGCT